MVICLEHGATDVTATPLSIPSLKSKMPSYPSRHGEDIKQAFFFGGGRGEDRNQLDSAADMKLPTAEMYVHDVLH